jgi:hypothetical protein
MRAAFLALVSALCLAACATLPPTAATPYLPAGVYGTYLDNDTGAINQSAWAFASPANTRGNPITAIKAVIALEYLPGELTENPRWVRMDDSVKVRLLQARRNVRDILGIRQDAPPQMVVNILLRVAEDLEAADPASAIRMLGAPVFTRPPEETLRLLSNLPYVQTANLATSRAASEMFPPGGARG